MLAGRYPSDEFAELRPRIVWDRTGGVVRGRPGVRRLAVTNAGTIPDRGLFGVFLVEGGGRVGELDEEMVYEARAGQVFLLGASSWRIEEITRDRVLVSPAPGVPGAVPFWKGEGIGRPYELGEAIGRASRELVALSDAQALERLTARHFLDERAAGNLITFLREQAAATGAVPSDRTVVVERFRDEIGDWRVCILTPFGARVHAPWALALAARLRDSLGVEVQSLWSDDGIALHLPDADAPPALAELAIGPDEIEELVVQEVGQTALFGARFRENAARALLIPRRRPGQRTPLWQQRLKAQSLLQVARRYGSFPVVLETYRECLQDVFDLPALKRLLHGLQTRAVDLVDVETASASPYAASLLFDYIATYMYEDDTPPAERRAQALSLDRDLLRELLGQEELRDLLDPGRAGRRRDAAARGAADPGRAPRRAAAARRPARRRAGPGARGAPRRRAASGLGTGRGRGAPDRRRGRGPLPRRARRDAAERAARRLPRRRPGVADPARAALRARARAVHDRRGDRALRPRRRAGAARARARREARPRRAAPGRHRAGVVRAGRPAPPSPRLARRAPPRGRARRAGRARPLPPALARDRPARDPARGARAAAGPAAPGLALGVGRPAAPRPRLPARAARRPLRLGRARLGRRGARPRRRLLQGRRAGARPSRRSAAARRRGARAAPRRGRAQRRVLVRPSRRRGARRRGRPARALGSRLGG